MRLDVLVLERGLASSRHQAQGLILAGRILVNNEPLDKPGAQVAIDAELRRKGELPLFVSRGGEKLAGAITYFGCAVEGVVALDVGSSTGGFTDCLLQSGAQRVYAVDVGTNQLAHKIRVHPKVVVMEQTDARSLTKEHFGLLPSLVTIDVSFIGLTKVLPTIVSIVAPEAYLLALVKPQFELEPQHIAKGGVVRDQAKAQSSVDAVVRFLQERGATVIGTQAAVLKGSKKGNQEYFVYARLS